jgi:hypothetical protein
VTAIRIRKFDGIAPKVAPKLLPPTYAQESNNCKPWSGNLRPWREPSTVNTPSKAGDILSIYYYANTYWLHWTTDVDVVKGPIEGDAKKRIYYTGDGAPKLTNTDLVNAGAGTDYPKDYYTLGIPAPADAPGVVAASGVGAAETRVYIWTLVSTLGEEGKPSQPTTVIGKVDDTWTISMGKTVVSITRAGSTATATITGHGYSTGLYILMMGADQAEYNGIFQITVTGPDTFTYAVTGTPATPATGTIKATKYDLTNGDSVITKKYLYRVASGTEYLFVAEVAINTTTYVDAITAANLGEVIPSRNYDVPPTDLKGLTEFPGGILVGFSPALQQLCFSEPFQPHAWPTAYRRTIPDIVGIGVYGNTVVVATTGFAYRVSGTHPSAMSSLKAREPYACLSKRGIMSLGQEGVIFPIPEGQVVIGIGGERVITEPILGKDEWADFSPSTIRAKSWNQRYVGFYETEIINGIQLGGGFIVEFKQGQANMFPLGFFAYALYTHPEDGALYLLIKDGSTNYIKKFDAGGSNMSLEWTSGVFAQRKLSNMAYARVLGEFAPLVDASQQVACDAEQAAQIAANAASIAAAGANGLGAINSAAINEHEVNGDGLIDVKDCDFTQGRSFNFTLYGDGVERYSTTIMSDEPFPLPEGYEARDWSVKGAGKIFVEEIAFANSIEELSQ